MLQICNIKKQYVTGELTQRALDGVSLNLRKNEFVAILGPSGSGKTTLLNIIGGLDRYDSGDLIINGISTAKYTDRDWDSYRNHTIGFVFQSYNLIPHQSVLSNVELALTISGVGRTERRERAKKALEQVGLGDQMHKKPNQMSGGQMQRVAIARALVNDPDILLADEPTGALDTETSVQVMDMLKAVAKDRLVVMVTHNPELAQKYATRIVRLQDGKIISDSDPYEIDGASRGEAKHKNMGKSSMSLRTALALSFNNLSTKKARTLLTSFAGSIGIIGIALILALSNGVNTYIQDTQKETMAAYPITIEERTIDLNSMRSSAMGTMNDAEQENETHGDAVYSDPTDLKLVNSMSASITENNLSNFKQYLDADDCPLKDYVGENGIVYSYNTKFGVYAYDPDGVLLNTDGSTLENGEKRQNGMMTMMNRMTGMSQDGNTNFSEMLPGRDGESISRAVMDSYDVVYGKWPEEYDEVVLVLSKGNSLPSTALYQLGYLPSAEYKKIMQALENKEEQEFDTAEWSYEDICAHELFLIPDCDTYVKGENGNYECVADNDEELEKLLNSAVKLKIVGIIRPTEDAKSANITGAVGYTRALSEYIIDHTDESAVVKAQRESKDTNVLSGMAFAPEDDAARIADVKKYIGELGITQKAEIYSRMLAANPDAAAQYAPMGESELAAGLDMAMENADDETLLSLYDAYISAGSYDENMDAFGVVSYDAPSSISIYSDSFEAKDAIAACIDDYNNTASEENKISYTDYVGLLMSSVTKIVDVVSYVLIAFVAVSLVVSSIMIGIITYISVLERTKEIGILRAIGASKRNISEVFNAETFIIGLCSGAIGVGITLLLLIPGNVLIHKLTETTAVNASLPAGSAAILIALSVLLTLIGGLIPSKQAARKDPVTALRTE